MTHQLFKQQIITLRGQSLCGLAWTSAGAWSVAHKTKLFRIAAAAQHSFICVTFAWNNTPRLNILIGDVHSINRQGSSRRPAATGGHIKTWHPHAPCCHVQSEALLICLLNYISSTPFRVAFVTASDRYAGAAEANKGLRLLQPALPPVTTWYLLRALF